MTKLKSCLDNIAIAITGQPNNMKQPDKLKNSGYPVFLAKRKMYRDNLVYENRTFRQSSMVDFFKILN